MVPSLFLCTSTEHLFSHQQDVRAIGPAREPAEVIDERGPWDGEGARRLERCSGVAHEVPFAVSRVVRLSRFGEYSLGWGAHTRGVNGVGGLGGRREYSIANARRWRYTFCWQPRHRANVGRLGGKDG